MSAEYIRYTRPPGLYISYGCNGLSCGTSTVTHDGDSFICSDCGTAWDHEDDPGTLYPEWSGEDLDGPEVDPDEWCGHTKALAAAQAEAGA